MSLTFMMQALLARHEAYMAEATEERCRMVGSIEKLEADKKELQISNTRIIEENRYLLDQLEEMNETASHSDAEIQSLNATLESTHKEIERLTVLAAQTSHLEAQLASLELEAADLHHQVSSREEEKKTAVQRWKGAERTISALQDQVDRIDREAQEERLRHAEIVKRLERRTVVERELENAAGRLKGAAAATTLGKDGKNSVVSHFVKDILQDNANLQLGIVELRGMLRGSNEEVENLREQMILHQPVQPYPERPESREDLGSELARTSNETVLSPNFHVHHHYHAAPKVKTVRETPVGLTKTKKRRNITSPGLRTPSSCAQTPRRPRTPSTHSIHVGTDSSAATILSQTSVTIPPLQSHRWSLRSSQAPSSLPSSPQSAFRNPSVFDSMDEAMYSSRPTTPGSATLGSPSMYPRHHKRNSDVSTRSMSTQLSPSVPEASKSGVLSAADQHSMDDPTESIKFPLLDQSIIPEEPEDDSTISFLDDHFGPPNTHAQPIQPRLHRASSYESLLCSRRGGTITVPKMRNKRSQGFNPPSSSFGPGSISSVGPVTSSMSAVIAQASKRDRRGYDSCNYNRLLLGGRNASITSSTNTIRSSTKNPNVVASATVPERSTTATLGRRVGGWVLGKWGVAPAKSTRGAVDVLSAAAAGGGEQGERSAPFSSSVRGRRKAKEEEEGDGKENRLSVHVEAVDVDKMLLRESLVDG